MDASLVDNGLGLSAEPELGEQTTGAAASSQEGEAMMENADRSRVSQFDLVAVTLLQLAGAVLWCAVTLTTISMSSRIRWESAGIPGAYAIWHAGVAANSWILWVGLAAILNHGVPLLAIFGARTERVCLTQVVCSIAGALVLLCGWIFLAAEMLLRS